MFAMNVISELRAWLRFDWLVQVMSVALQLHGVGGMNCKDVKQSPRVVSRVGAVAWSSNTH